MKIFYDGSLEGLFVILDGVLRGAPIPRRLPGSASPPGNEGSGAVLICPGSPFSVSPVQPELFQKVPGSGPASAGGLSRRAFVPDPGGEFSHPLARELFEVSADASCAFIQAWMSEYPIEEDIIRFGWRVLSAARNAGAGTACGISSPEARTAAERATAGWGDRGTETVLKAACKVGHEIHRLIGFLRFTRDVRGPFLARCAPDHFSLPGLASHFTRRFGAEPWAVIDEKRRLILLRLQGEAPRLVPADAGFFQNTPPSQGPQAAGKPRTDPWEELWRNYHHSINNEGRKNPGLQRQFMPVRYWKYLPEMNFRDEKGH
jgi:hypothetical protein